MTHRHFNKIWTLETIKHLVNWKFQHLRVLQIRANFAACKESFLYGFLKGNTKLAVSVRQWIWRLLTQSGWFKKHWGFELDWGKESKKILHFEERTLYFQEGACAPNIPPQLRHCKGLAKRLLKISRILFSITLNF